MTKLANILFCRSSIHLNPLNWMIDKENPDRAIRRKLKDVQELPTPEDVSQISNLYKKNSAD